MYLIIFEILLLFVIPIMLLYFKKINFKYRIHVISLIFIITLGIIILEKWSLFDLGIRTDNIGESIIPYALFTVIGVSALVIEVSSFINSTIISNESKMNMELVETVNQKTI